MYYVCTMQDFTVLAGPYPRVHTAALIVDAQPVRTDFYTMSRYQLGKKGRYPRNKAGDEALARDLADGAGRLIIPATVQDGRGAAGQRTTL